MSPTKIRVTMYGSTRSSDGTPRTPGVGTGVETTLLSGTETNDNPEEEGAGVAEEAPTLRRRSRPTLTSTQSSGKRLTSKSMYHMQVATQSQGEMDEMMLNFEKSDEFSRKTWSRLFVENILMRFKFYNPYLGKDTPSLKSAWAYYEHITLARHFVETTSEGSFERAEPGERDEKTQLYSPIWTPPSALKEWGIGVGLYFATLRFMVVIFLVAGFINLPNIFYYRSEEYNGVGGQADLPFTLQGSAICTNREWVACTDCSSSDFSPPRFATSAAADDGSTEKTVVFVERVLCEGANLTQGVVNIASLAWLLLALWFLGYYQRVREVRYDEDKSSPTDYTIMVTNPPPDATDPEEWREFFQQFVGDPEHGGVVVVTIALNNGRLVQELIRRRVLRNKVRLLLDCDRGELNWEDLDSVRERVRAYMEEKKQEEEEEETKTSCLGDCCCSALMNCLGMKPSTAEDLLDNVIKITEQIRNKWMKKKYKPTAVFVTFETEESQRRALHALNFGRLSLFCNFTRGVPHHVLFRGRRLLHVVEPEEPNAVRWLDLQVPRIVKFSQRILTFVLTVALIVLVGYGLQKARLNYSSRLYSILLSCCNVLVPQILKRLLMSLEHHSFETSWQASLYTKVTLFRWVMTTILTQLTTPFTSTLGDGSKELLRTVNNVLTAEMMVPPILRLVDIMGNIRKHICGPRSRTQEDMNLKFTGTPYNLGERYTDFTKVIFLCCFYAALHPNTFFIGAVILFIQYHVDRFALMRLWRSAPFIGTQLATFSRRYFFSTAIVALAVVSAYCYAQFPYDNICDVSTDEDTQGEEEGGYEGVYPVIFGNGTGGFINVTAPDAVKFCNQRLSPFGGRFEFPPVPSNQEADSHWMEGSQELLTSIYGNLTVVVVAGFVMIIFGDAMWSFVISLFHGTYEPTGKDQHIDFSTVQEIFGYVPQVRLRNFPFPFLACDIDDIDQGLVGWNDPTGSYDYYNLIFDVPHDGLRRFKRIVGNTRHKATVAGHLEHQEGQADDDNDNATKEETAGTEEAPPKDLVSTNGRPLFSIVKHWPPEWKKKLLAEQKSEGGGEATSLRYSM